jgi:hypothetical protein
MSAIPHSPVSRGSSPAREVRRSREYNYSHSGSDLEDALHGFSLVPSWLKVAMEKDQNGNSTSTQRYQDSQHRYSPVNSPESIVTTSSETTPNSIRVPELSVPVPKKGVFNTSEAVEKDQVEKNAEDDARYWDEQDDGYWGEMEGEEQEEDLEECYRSVH